MTILDFSSYVSNTPVNNWIVLYLVGFNCVDDDFEGPNGGYSINRLLKLSASGVSLIRNGHFRTTLRLHSLVIDNQYKGYRTHIHSPLYTNLSCIINRLKDEFA